jgi:hypothetical protein
VPFELRLLNGMNPPVPEVTVLIHRITKGAGEYRLHTKKVLGFRHCDKRNRKQKRRVSKPGMLAVVGREDLFERERAGDPDFQAREACAKFLLPESTQVLAP